MEESARFAAAGDLGVVAAMAEYAQDEVEESKGGPMYLRREARRPPVADSLSDAIDDPQQAVVVGALDTVGVGYATVTTEVLPDGARIAEIGEIFVLPDARGVGVGEVMLDAVMDWARTQGCTHLEGSVLPGNRAGKNFFERAAMVTRVLRVSTALEQSAP